MNYTVNMEWVEEYMYTDAYRHHKFGKHEYKYNVNIKGFFPTSASRINKLLKIIARCPDRDVKRAEFREKIGFYLGELENHLVFYKKRCEALTLKESQLKRIKTIEAIQEYKNCKMDHDDCREQIKEILAKKRKLTKNLELF